MGEGNKIELWTVTGRHSLHFWGPGVLTVIQLSEVRPSPHVSAGSDSVVFIPIGSVMSSGNRGSGDINHPTGRGGGLQPLERSTSYPAYQWGERRREKIPQQKLRRAEATRWERTKGGTQKKQQQRIGQADGERRCCLYLMHSGSRAGDADSGLVESPVRTAVEMDADLMWPFTTTLPLSGPLYTFAFVESRPISAAKKAKSSKSGRQKVEEKRETDTKLVTIAKHSSRYPRPTKGKKRE